MLKEILMDASTATGIAAWIPGVLQGVISNSLYSLLGHAGHFLRTHGEGIDETIKRSIASSGLETVVGSGPLAAGSAEQLRTFLASQESEAVVRQIYSLRLTDAKMEE
jgi:hypothetical protein